MHQHLFRKGGYGVSQRKKETQGAALTDKGAEGMYEAVEKGVKFLNVDLKFSPRGVTNTTDVPLKY